MNWGFDPIIISVAVALAAAVLGGAWWLWWRLPKQQVDRLRLTIRDPKARADVEDNFRKTIGQALGGIFVLLGVGLAYYGTFQTLQANQQSARDLLISNQVSKGFEQLASKEIIMRLGGIYALAGVMNISEQYHQPALETLCAFVRDKTRNETGDGPPATDIQAALTVIGRRERPPFELENTSVFVELSYAHIPGAYLFNAYLATADLRHVTLSGANLRNSDLSGAFLTDAIQTGTSLNASSLVEAELANAELTDADLSGADLLGANLRGATITQTQLDQACGTDVKLDPGLTIKPCP